MKNKGNKYIFLGGCGRSGTTLLRTILDIHENISVAPEIHYFDYILSSSKKFDFKQEKKKFVDRIFSKINKSNDKLWDNVNIEREDILDKNPQNKKDFLLCLLDLVKTKKDSDYIFEKTPANIFFIKKILSLFPEAKFIHLTRDGREFCASAHKRGWSKNLFHLSAYWVESLSYFGEVYKDRPNRLIEIRYEDLVNDPVKTINEVLNFIGIEEPVDSGFINKLENLSAINSSFNSKDSSKGLKESKNYDDYFNKEQKIKIQNLLKVKLKNRGYNLHEDYQNENLIFLVDKLMLWFHRFKIRLFFFTKRAGYYWLYCKISSKFKK